MNWEEKIWREEEMDCMDAWLNHDVPYINYIVMVCVNSLVCRLAYRVDRKIK